MARIARIVLEDVPFHITQRGNARQQVFFEAGDYRLYLRLLSRYAADGQLRILGYCLMPNHIQLIAVPRRATSMASVLSRTHSDYARHFHLRHGSCRHVWQGLYFSCPLDGIHLWNAMAYVERNPVRATLVQRAEEFDWSSVRERLGLWNGGRPGLLDATEWRKEYTADRWREVLATSVNEEAFGRRLHETSRRGRPLGSEEFALELEKRAGRPLRARPIGRPAHAPELEGEQLGLEIGG